MDAIEKPIIWIDLEMTGLNVASDTILEIAVAITDCWLHEIKQVEILSSITPEPYYASAKITNLVIHATDEVLNNMSNWCRVTFTASGLIQKVKQSRVTIEEADEKISQSIKNILPCDSCYPLGGNSISKDREFLCRYMPKTYQCLHYRSIDVTTIKLLCLSWYPELPIFEKQSHHRALDDILESIEELRYYRKHIFVNNEFNSKASARNFLLLK